MSSEITAAQAQKQLEQARVLVARYDRELSNCDDPRRAARLHFECGRLLERPINDLPAATGRYVRAYEIEPDYLPAVEGARRLFVRRRDHHSALPLLDAEVRMTSDSVRKAMLLYDQGRLLEDQMGQRTEARAAFASALALDPKNVSILKAQARADAAAGDWEALERTLEQTANALTADSRHRAAVLAQRARLVEAHRADTHLAVELYQQAIRFDPAAPGAVQALKRLLYAHERWADLATVLEIEANQAAEPAARALALYRIGRIQVSRLGNVEAGLEAMERAAAVAPDDVMVLEELARLYELAQRYDALVRALERLVDRAQSPAEKVGRLQRIGQLLEEKLSDEAGAIEWNARALECDPAYLPALQALGKLYTRRGDWERLVAMHLAEVETTSDVERRAAGHARIAEILADQLDRAEEAVEHHKRAVGLVPGYTASFKSLERLYTEAQRYRELVELYERAVDAAQDHELRVTYLFKIGRLYEDALAAPADAMNAFQRVLSIDRRNLGALHALQRSAERAQQYEKLVSALVIEAGLLEQKDQVCALLHRAGEICEQQLNDPDAALRRYRRVVQTDPLHRPTLASLGRLYYRLGRWEDLLDTYRGELAASERSADTAPLLCKMGELCERHLGRDDEAVQCYREALEVDPFHTPSLHALARKLTERGNWTELVKLLELELSGLKDRALRARTAYRIGEVYESRLRAQDKAAAAYEQALGADPDFRPALDARARLLVQAKEFNETVLELKREIASAAEPTLAVAALMRRGEVYRDDLDVPGRALECFEAVLERDPAHLGALLALESLYTQMGTWEQLVEDFSTQARILGDAGARVAVLRELARVQEVKEIGGQDALQQTYFSILQLDPTDITTLRALERIALTKGDSKLLAHLDAKLAALLSEPRLSGIHCVRLAEYLESVEDPSALQTYQMALDRDPDSLAATRGLARLAANSGDPKLLQQAAENLARVARDMEGAAQVYCSASRALVESKPDDPQAATCLTRALDVAPGYLPAAEQLRELLLGRGEADQLRRELVRAANACTEAAPAVALWTLIAKVDAEERNDLPGAVAALRHVLDERPGHVPTMLELARLYERDRRWSNAVEQLENALKQSPTAREAADARYRLADILHQHLDDPDGATAHLRAVLAVDPSDISARIRLADVFEKAGRVEEAIASAMNLVEHTEDPADQARVLGRVARLEAARGDADGALDACDRALELAGLVDDVSQQYKAIATAQEKEGDATVWARYAQALSRHLGSATAKASGATAVALELANVLDQKLNHPDKAVGVLRTAAANSDSKELAEALASQLERAGQIQHAVREFKRLIHVDPTRPESWRQLAGVLRRAQRNHEADLAVDALRALGAHVDPALLKGAVSRPRPADVRAGTFDPRAFNTVDLLAVGDTTRELVAVLAEPLSKLYPPELGRYGLTTRDRLAPRSTNIVRLLANDLAAAFGVEEFDLYVHRGAADRVEVELADPPAILVPATFASLPQPQTAFLLARVMANLARGLHPVDRVPARQLELLLASAARFVQPQFGAGRFDENELEQTGRGLGKAISWRGRRQVEEAAQRYAGAPPRDFAEWVGKVGRTTTRIALVLADDLAGCLKLVRRMDTEAVSTAEAGGPRPGSLANELLTFWVSDAAISLRQHLGIP